MQIRNYRKIFDGDTAGFGKVAVLFGGDSAEREVSLNSGNAVLEALLKKGVDAHGFDFVSSSVSEFIDQQFDSVFIVLHGVGGEDGKVQAMLDMLNIPYTGSNHSASALGMDKLRTKQVWQTIGLSTPRYIKLDQYCDWASAIAQLGGRAFVKPTREGSSIGMTIANSAEQLQENFVTASEHGTEVIAETLIDGDEVTVAVLNDNVLPIIQVVSDNQFYDYDAKYQSNSTQYLCPANVDIRKEQQIKAIALEAFSAIGCSGWGRVDIMLDKMGHPHLLEVNTVPGMTSHSLVPMAAQAQGLDFDDLVLEILMQVKLKTVNK